MFVKFFFAVVFKCALVMLLCREVEEECGAKVDLSELQRMGVNLFEFVDNPVLMEVHVFLAEKFSGTTVSLQPFF